MSMHVVRDQRAILGECLLWQAQSASWWWVDIDGQSLYCWQVESDVLRSFALPEKIGSFVFCQSGKLLLGLAKRVVLFDPLFDPRFESCSEQLQTVAEVETHLPDTRINDGRTDRAGNYVFGTIDQQIPRQAIASFYQYSPVHGLRRLALPNVAIANSICFSVDGKTMYFSDTPSRRIMQCAYDAESATVGEPTLFAETEEGAFPDGSVIDRQGCLWNAQWGAAQIVKYAPDGSVMRRVPVPVKNPTCPAFGGADLDILMVTSSRKDMSEHELQQMPQAGGLFQLTAGEVARNTGLLDAVFEDRIYEGETQ